MIIPFATTAGALALGALLPARWGVFGFLGAAALLFAIQAAVRTVSGFSDSTIEENLILFNSSRASYIGFNLQLTYRAFALPLLGLAALLVWRTSRH